MSYMDPKIESRLSLFTENCIFIAILTKNSLISVGEKHKSHFMSLSIVFINNDLKGSIDTEL